MRCTLKSSANSTRSSGLKHDGWECILELRTVQDDNYITIEGIDIDADGGEYCIEAFQKGQSGQSSNLWLRINSVSSSVYNHQFMNGNLNGVSAARQSSNTMFSLPLSGGGVQALSYGKMHLRRIGTKYVYVAHSAGDIIEGTRHGDTMHWSGEITVNQNLTVLNVFTPVGNIGAGTLFRIYKRARLA